MQYVIGLFVIIMLINFLPAWAWILIIALFGLLAFAIWRSTSAPEQEPVAAEASYEPALTSSARKPITYLSLTAQSAAELAEDFVVIDIETTGFDKHNDYIIELSAVRFKDFEPVDTFTSLIDNDCTIPRKITELTGIHRRMLTGKPSLWGIKDDFISFIGDSVVVGQYLDFDIGFLRSNTINLPSIEGGVYDTMRIAKYDLRLPTPNHKLGTLCEYFDVESSTHRSEQDCISTGYVFKHLLDMYLVKA